MRDTIKKLVEDLFAVAVVITLVMQIFPYPRNFASYTEGFVLGFALVYFILNPARFPSMSRLWPAWLPYGVLFVLYLLSCFWSVNPSDAFVYCGKYFLLLLMPLGFLGMGADYFTPKRIRIFAVSFVAGVLVGALWKLSVTLHCYFTDVWVVSCRSREFLAGGVKFLRFYRAYIAPYKLMNANFEALYFNAAFLLVLYERLKGHEIFERRPLRIAADITLVLLALILLFFSTKFGMTACLATILVMWIYAWIKRRRVFAVGVLSAFLLLGGVAFPLVRKVVFPKFTATVENMESFCRGGETKKDGSFSPRVVCLQTAWKMFKEKPCTGYGINYLQQFRRNLPYKIAHPHNQFIHVALALGLLGLGVFVWIWVNIIAAVVRRKSLFWWIWAVELSVFCLMEVLFYRTAGLFYLCAFHGVLIIFDKRT